MKTVFALIPLSLLSAFLLLAPCALGQAGQASPPEKDKAKAATIPAAPTPPAGITVSEPSFLFPVEERIKIRDLQVENDELEIENQKMLLKIEQNKTRQGLIMDGIKADAYQYAQTRHVNLEVYQLNLKEITLDKKRAK